MAHSEIVNIFKYTDYGDPIVSYKTDYRTANARAHRFCLSVNKNFVPSKSHVLCKELGTGRTDYRPRSESSKEFTWKINLNRNHREELAPSSLSVRYSHNFTDSLKASKLIIPLKSNRSWCSEIKPYDSLPREPKLTIVGEPKIDYAWRETHFNNTEGYFPHADPLVSTTEIDFHPHSNYSTAKTNLIVRKELPFNSDDAFMIPNSKLINENPLRNKYCNRNIRDISKFSTPTYDRIIPNRSQFVTNFGLTTEMTSNY